MGNAQNGKQKMTKAQLKEVIVDLKMQLVKASIPKDHCPYPYYRIPNPTSDCSSIGCTACHTIFEDNMRKLIEAEVAKM